MKDTLKEIVEACTKKLTVSVSSIEVLEEHEHTVVSIRSSDSGILIGSNGENLRALNAIVRRIVEKRLGAEAARALLIDVNGYYARKTKEIKQQAKLLGDRARLFKSDVEMNPMNPYERMIVHSMFADDPEIKTESVGEGKGRHVVIRYKERERDMFPTDSSLLAS